MEVFPLAVKLRLRRMGTRKKPFYRFIASDSRFKRDGRFLETLGYYNPMEKSYELHIDREKVLNWLKNGAQMTDTVESLLRKEGIVQEINKEKFTKKSSSKPKENVEPQEEDSGDKKV